LIQAERPGAVATAVSPSRMPGSGPSMTRAVVFPKAEVSREFWRRQARALKGAL
jgi:hypothetical protein